jgi:hypothetical protein
MSLSLKEHRMEVLIVGRKIVTESFDQYKVKVLVDLSREDMKKNLYHIMAKNPDLWEYMDQIKEKMITKGLM